MRVQVCTRVHSPTGVRSPLLRCRVRHMPLQLLLLLLHWGMQRQPGSRCPACSTVRCACARWRRERRRGGRSMSSSPRAGSTTWVMHSHGRRVEPGCVRTPGGGARCNHRGGRAATMGGGTNTCWSRHRCRPWRMVVSRVAVTKSATTVHRPADVGGAKACGDGVSRVGGGGATNCGRRTDGTKAAPSGYTPIDAVCAAPTRFPSTPAVCSIGRVHPPAHERFCAETTSSAKGTRPQSDQGQGHGAEAPKLPA